MDFFLPVLHCGICLCLHSQLLTLLSTELSGEPPSTWMGVALASDDCCDLELNNSFKNSMAPVCRVASYLDSPRSPL